MRKYQLPLFLEGIITQDAYDKWIDRKAKSHFKRTKKEAIKSYHLKFKSFYTSRGLLFKRG